MELVTYFTPQGSKTALVKRGRKLIHVLLIDNGLVVKKVPLTEERYIRPVIQEKKVPSLNGTVRKFASYGRRYGATKAAKKFLKEARS